MARYTLPIMVLAGTLLTCNSGDTSMPLAVQPNTPAGPGPVNLDSGLVAHYLLDGDARDTSGNGLHGTVNGATPAADRFGVLDHALRFDGYDDWIDFGDVAALHALAGLSVSAWAVTDSNDGENGWMVAKGDGSAGGSAQTFHLRMGAGGVIGVLFVDSSTQSFHVTTAAADVAGRWVHVVYVVTHTTATVYLDGATAAQNGVDGTIRTCDQHLLAAANGWSVGLPPWAHSPQYGVGFWGGVLDDIRIYGRALTSEEVVGLYELGNTGVIRR